MLLEQLLEKREGVSFNRSRQSIQIPTCDRTGFLVSIPISKVLAAELSVAIADD